MADFQLTEAISHFARFQPANNVSRDFKIKLVGLFVFID